MQLGRLTANEGWLISCPVPRDEAMRSQTKIAVGVGAVIVALGLYFVASGKKPAKQADTPTPIADVDKTIDSTTPPDADVGRPPVTDIPSAPSGMANVASPPAKQVESVTKSQVTREAP